MDVYVKRDAVLDELYIADAITMRGVAILNRMPAEDVVPGEVYRQAIETLEKVRDEANMRYEQAVEAEEALYSSNRVEIVRCKNCRNSDMIGCTRYCFHWERNVDDEGYCNEGV